MYKISVTGHFDAGHYLRGYNGKCSRPHGHRFSYEIVLERKELNNLGMVVDFADVKQLMKEEIEEKLDHYMLNDIPPFDKINPTAENLAHHIYDIAWNEGQNTYAVTEGEVSIKVVRVRVWESPDCYAEYYEE